ncbi:MAG TPA: isocitrate lyase/phosphoenolpyruvate mutase family protein [Gemmatimonadales bacterium]|nr:isocitrate lyase/phosphoenolpyruvate mutase family protein [Gemmatimonadales bacterium]
MVERSRLTTVEKGRRFQALHRAGRPLLISNPWDAGTARLLEWVGFEALTTTSAGLAFGDLENGYGDSPETVAETVHLAGEVAGLVGGSIEDASGNPDRPIYDFGLAVERMAAAAEAARALPFPFVLVGRAENYLYGRRDLDDTIRRLQAFEDAGADVLFAPGITSAEDIRTVCAAVRNPVNVVMGLIGATFSVADLAALGVRRISVGSALSRVALAAVVTAARHPRLFVGTAVLLVVVSIAACLIPGWRATRADLVQALSAE